MRPPDRALLSRAAAVIGAVRSVVSMAWLPWFRFAAPDVIGPDGRFQPPPDVLPFGDPSDIDSQARLVGHPLPAWALVIVLIAVTAVAVSGHRPTFTVARILGPVLSALVILDATLVGAVFFVPYGDLPGGGTLDRLIGLWIAVAGFALLGLAALSARRTPGTDAPVATEPAAASAGPYVR